jgi:hypothetical protein
MSVHGWRPVLWRGARTKPYELRKEISTTLFVGFSLKNVSNTKRHDTTGGKSCIDRGDEPDV